LATRGEWFNATGIKAKSTQEDVMSQQIIRFDDGEAYERAMGIWSRFAGEVFLDWLAPASGLRWIDVGCGNGAFTELVTRRCAPAEIQGIDPSDGQLAFARTRPGAKGAAFQKGDAMALPFEANRFDVAVMALVIFFVPDPSKGVEEMARVVAPGGWVSAYAWDLLGGCFPFAPIQAELRALGMNPPQPPNPGAASPPALQALWTDAGLEAIETREITVRRNFTDFDDFWGASTAMGTLKPVLDSMTPNDLQKLKDRVRARLTEDSGTGGVSYQARAYAVKGRVPK
jgi:ubiquinone/menaquinone biosynthesis C-methylase UbiE